METDVIVIGAGVIGLATACAISRNGHSVVLLEKEARYGTGISSRNTETIHAGIYYQTGSLKAGLCLEGKRLLYEHCVKYGVRHKRIGKLFVAVTSQEESRLEQTMLQAKKNGVLDVTYLDKRQVHALEPHLCAESALLSPSSGILDVHGFMDSLFAIGRSQGVVFAALSPVLGAEANKIGWSVLIGGREPARIACRAVINTAGLYAIEISKNVFPGRQTPTLYPTKGSYARYSGASPVNHIIYPSIIPGVIEERVDAAPDIAGSLRFGPNVEEPKNLEDFSMHPGLIQSMTRGIKRYLPALDATRLLPDISGIRPKIYGPKDPVKDFIFDWADTPGWLDLWGIESPGLTASLAIGNHVYAMLKDKQLV